jgi:hypothetical protein
MRRSPHILLLCLVVCTLCSSGVFARSSDFIKVIIKPETTYQSPLRLSGTPEPLTPSESNGPLFKQASWSPHGAGSGLWPNPAFKPVVKCKAPVCPPGELCPVPFRPPCVLPRRGCRQFELSVQAFFARVSGRVHFPSVWFGISHPDVDFNDGLGFPSWKTLLEYSAWCQFRPNWAFYYSIMPIQIESTYVNPRLPGTVFRSKWDFIYQRVGLLYTPIRSCNGNISIFGGWVFNDSKLRLNNANHCANNSTCTLDRTRNMAQTGIDLQRCIRTLCNGGTLTCDNRVGISYLDGTVVLDVQTSLRYSVPMNCGRWGYARGGFRYLNFREDRNDVSVDSVTFQGGFVEGGLIF